ncbi:hypothetical protein FVE85_1056 [Porphyridium purpureum]|uniref:Uncharacterized protein n=1 Tax=Porphyridium purpureum TaxID=35688 RepID=A0A5J4Z3V1_PORPP|nr:hypothetical protein FVE85_1056 [Porphyridium purpureum]|eukprot:POR2340..scf208_2
MPHAAAPHTIFTATQHKFIANAACFDRTVKPLVEELREVARGQLRLLKVRDMATFRQNVDAQRLGLRESLLELVHVLELQNLVVLAPQNQHGLFDLSNQRADPVSSTAQEFHACQLPVARKAVQSTDTQRVLGRKSCLVCVGHLVRHVAQRLGLENRNPELVKRPE